MANSRGRKRVTICIAASCEVGRDTPPCNVICSDMQITHGTAKGDIAFKNRFLVGGWALAFAGDIQEEHAVSRHIREVFADNMFREINETNIGSLLLEAIKRRKHAVGIELAAVRFGISYAKLRRMARGGIPAVSGVMQEIADWHDEYKVAYIVTGLVYGLAYLVEVVPGFAPVFRDDFAVVGSGVDEACGHLTYREQSPIRSIGRTILAVYETKKFVESLEPSVGPKTTICVQHQGEDEPHYLKEDFIREVLDPMCLDIAGMETLPAAIPDPPPEAYDKL